MVRDSWKASRPSAWRTASRSTTTASVSPGSAERTKCGAASPRRTAELDPAPEDGQQLEQSHRGLVELAQPVGDALGERLRQPPEDGGGEIGALLEEGLDEPDGVERVSLGALLQPLDEGTRHPVPDDRLGQDAQVVGTERA